MTQTIKKKKNTKKGQDKRNKILETARKFFIKYDSTGFSTADIAKHLNMTQANFYHYFSSKRDLWFAVTLEYQYEIRNRLLEIMGQNVSYFDKFLLMVKFYFNFAKNNSDLIFIHYKTSPPGGKEIGPYESETKTEFNQANLRILEKIFHSGIESGEFISDLIPDDVVFFYWSLIYGGLNFFMIPDMHDCFQKNGAIDYTTLKRIEKYERNITKIIESDLTNYLSE